MVDEHKLTKGDYFAKGRFPVEAGRAHKCPVCERYVFPTGNSHEICEVCRWQDCGICESDPDYRGGPNDMSLNQAREAYRKGIPLRKR
ncbi:MAG: hypothetical protein LBD04_06695 [Synergistaceae bacterium]|nr:hypothetical protein [Synergistaceae bacterium]